LKDFSLISSVALGKCRYYTSDWTLTSFFHFFSSSVLTKLSNIEGR